MSELKPGVEIELSVSNNTWGTELRLDGVPVANLKNVRLEHEAGEVPTLTVEISLLGGLTVPERHVIKGKVPKVRKVYHAIDENGKEILLTPIEKERGE